MIYLDAFLVIDIYVTQASTLHISSHLMWCLHILYVYDFTLYIYNFIIYTNTRPTHTDNTKDCPKNKKKKNKNVTCISH